MCVFKILRRDEQQHLQMEVMIIRKTGKCRPKAWLTTIYWSTFVQCRPLLAISFALQSAEFKPNGRVTYIKLLPRPPGHASHHQMPPKPDSVVSISSGGCESEENNVTVE